MAGGEGYDAGRYPRWINSMKAPLDTWKPAAHFDVRGGGPDSGGRKPAPVKPAHPEVSPPGPPQFMRTDTANIGKYDVRWH